VIGAGGFFLLNRNALHRTIIADSYQAAGLTLRPQDEERDQTWNKFHIEGNVIGSGSIRAGRQVGGSTYFSCLSDYQFVSFKIEPGLCRINQHRPEILQCRYNEIIKTTTSVHSTGGRYSRISSMNIVPSPPGCVLPL
jgi:hypothetical protein